MGYLHFNSRYAAKKWSKKQSQTWWKSLSASEKFLFIRYKAPTYFHKHINISLRNTERNPSASKMLSALRRSSLPEGLVLIRNTHISFLESNGYTIETLEREICSGNTIILSEKGLMSTSLYKAAWKKITKVRLIINVPPGSKGALIDCFPLLSYEFEVLLCPPCNLLVEKIERDKKNNRVQIWTTLINQTSPLQSDPQTLPVPPAPAY